MNLILKSNKKIGQTPKELLDLLQKQTTNKYFHTGNLDVMAEGLMVFVSKKLRFFEKVFKKMPKTYEFEVVFGFNTDTYDLLGLIKQTTKQAIPSETRINNAVKKISGQKFQKPPVVSYKNLNTKKKLNNFLKGKKLPELKPKKTRIIKIVRLDKKTVYKEDLVRKIYEIAPLIKKDYRQRKVEKSYAKTCKQISNELVIIKFKAKVSSGFYIRAFTRDFGNYLKYPVCTYSIKRTKVGFIKL